jgi:type I restriction enzyme S subunit
MTTNFSTVQLDSVLDFKEGPGILAKDFRTDGVPLIRLAGVKRGVSILSGCNFLDPEMVKKKWAHFALELGDVLLSTSASLGEVAMVSEDGVGAIPYTGLIRFRSKTELVSPRFIPIALSSTSFKRQIEAMGSGSVLRHFGPMHLREMTLDLPPIHVQEQVADVVGALNDKIESNQRIRTKLRQLGGAYVLASLSGDSSRHAPLAELTQSITRGVTPKYADDDPEAYMVLNQKCVRANWVSTEPARFMVYRDVAPAKVVSDGDILVNSTGTGTLGRVGRWHTGTVFADSHVSVVKPATDEIGPTLLAYLMFDLQDQIEDMATGSTGQTELSASSLGELVIEYPGQEDSLELEDLLLAFENRADRLRKEEHLLAAVRDTLLPELLSGRIRVPEAEEAVAEVVA